MLGSGELEQGRSQLGRQDHYHHNDRRGRDGQISEIYSAKRADSLLKQRPGDRNDGEFDNRFVSLALEEGG